MAGKPVVRPATLADLKTFYGRSRFGPTVKAMVGELDGVIVAVGGFAIVGGRCIAFCDLTEAARPYKHHLHRTALRLFAEARRRHKFIFASADPDEPGATKWLSRLGFKHMGDDTWRV